MGDYFVCSKTDPVVETKAGKVRGFRLNTTYAFHGIHYAEADRFQMPLRRELVQMGKKIYLIFPKTRENRQKLANAKEASKPKTSKKCQKGCDFNII